MNQNATDHDTQDDTSPDAGIEDADRFSDDGVDEAADAGHATDEPAAPPVSEEARSLAHDEVAALSPDKQMAGFTDSRFGVNLGISAAALAVLLTVFSLGYLRIAIQDMFDPAGAAARAEAREAANKPPAPEPAPAPPSTQGDATANADGKSPDGATSGEGTGETEDTAKGDGKSPIEQAVDEVATPDEIPDKPDDTLLNLDDTNL